MIFDSKLRAMLGMKPLEAPKEEVADGRPSNTAVFVKTKNMGYQVSLLI